MLPFTTCPQSLPADLPAWRMFGTEELHARTQRLLAELKHIASELRTLATVISTPLHRPRTICRAPESPLHTSSRFTSPLETPSTFDAHAGAAA